MTCLRSLSLILFLLIDHFPASSRFTRTVVELALQSVLFHLFDLTSLFLIAIIYDNTYIYTTIRDVSSRRVSSFSLGGSVSGGGGEEGRKGEFDFILKLIASPEKLTLRRPCM